jgi:hypothetical protein
MKKLVTCLECGHSIAQSAVCCPKCKTDSPHGVPCEACNKKMNKKQAITFTFFGQRNASFYYHPECIQKILSIPSNIQCLDCGHHIDASILPLEEITKENSCNFYDNHFLPSCPECGSVDVLQRQGFCALCKMPIYGFHPMREGQNEKYPYPFSNNLLFHECCVQHTSKKWVHESINRMKRVLSLHFRLF